MQIQISLCIYAVKAIWTCAYAYVQPNRDTTLYLHKSLKFFIRDFIDICLSPAVWVHLAEILPSACPLSMGFKQGFAIPRAGVHTTSALCIVVLWLLFIKVYIGRLDSSVGRASAFGAGGRGFESCSRTIPKV